MKVKIVNKLLLAYQNSEDYKERYVVGKCEEIPIWYEITN
jgi:hypothetical protein